MTKFLPYTSERDYEKITPSSDDRKFLKVIGQKYSKIISSYTGKIAKFYKRAYPFAGILILIFEAWAIFIQVNKFGIKTGEYSFISIWIFASISLVLLILLKDRAYRKIAILAAAISIIVVL